MPIGTPSQFWQLKTSPNNTKYLLWFFWGGRRQNHWLRLKQKKKQFLYFLLHCGNGKYFSSRRRVTYLLNWELMSNVLPTSGFLRIETGSTPGEIIPAWDKISMSGHWGAEWNDKKGKQKSVRACPTRSYWKWQLLSTPQVGPASTLNLGSHT